MHYAVENSLSLYERNFNKLMHLLPGLTRRRGLIALAVAGRSSIVIEILEQNPYTTTIHIHQDMAEGRPWITDLGMKVRICHDAQVAEVIAYQGVHSLRSFYTYPNPKMLQPYEKRRVNQFLGEWLGFCLIRGSLVSG